VLELLAWRRWAGAACLPEIARAGEITARVQLYGF
jgi:hypothetical protein